MQTSDSCARENSGPIQSAAAPLLETAALEIANHLLAHRHSAQAANLLIELINANIRGVSARTVTTLARIFYDEKDWRQASGLWKAVVGADPENLEGLVKLSHCLFELGETTAARDLRNRALAILRRAATQGESGGIDAILEAVYQRIYEHFVAGDQTPCEKLLNFFALPGSYAGNTVGIGAGSGEVLSDEAIASKIDSAFDQWRLKRGGVEPASSDSGAGAAPSETRAFMVFRQFFFADNESREHEIPAFFRESAKALGIQFDFFPSERLHARSDRPPEEQYSAINDLVRALLAAKPHLVILDDFFALSAPVPYVGREVFRNVLIAIRKQIGCKLVAFYLDPWSSESSCALEYASEFVDIVWHQNPVLARETMKERPEKFFAAPIPYPEALFPASHGRKTINGAFLGSVVSYNYLRAIWCALIRGRRIPCQLFFASHAKTASPAGDTIQEYAAFLSRIRVMVNLNARTPRRKVVTGRVWESILSKALVLEEENEDLAHYFVPFVHYIPFRNVVELEAYLRFFEGHEAMRRRIVEEAYAWFQLCYSKERVWRGLIDAALHGRRTSFPGLPTAGAAS
ncbi:MAG: glycosyltransferase [Verrucomicrobia bacterium]|nr:glycosyltransferase [Verrucomicrobiota bacterium]